MSRSLERLIGIDREIRRGRYPKVENLCELFEVKKRTIYEDIRKLKENFGLDIEYDRFHEGYILKNPEKKLPSFDLTEGELTGLTVSGKIVAEQANFLQADIESGIEKVKSRVPEKIEKATNGIGVQFQNMPLPLPKVSSKFFSLIRKAIGNRNPLAIKYYAASKNSESERTIEPYKILQRQGTWYLIGYCTMRNDLRLFAIHRIKHLSLLEDQTFEPRKECDIDAWLERAFQLERGEKEWLVHVVFSSEAAPYIREKAWKNDTQVVEHKDGKCTLIFTTLSLDEVKRWVMYYGRHAVVMSPRALVEMIQEEHKSAYENYAASSETLDTVKVDSENSGIA